jgi:hypothetical protein
MNPITGIRCIAHYRPRAFCAIPAAFSKRRVSLMRSSQAFGRAAEYGRFVRVRRMRVLRLFETRGSLSERAGRAAAHHNIYEGNKFAPVWSINVHATTIDAARFSSFSSLPFFVTALAERASLP